jgi:uncharacterized protein YjdB
MTYDSGDGVIYWSFFTYTGEAELFTIVPATASATASAAASFSSVEFPVDAELVGMLTMDEDADFVIPEADAVTRMVISDSEVLLRLGESYSLSVNLLPWNAPVEGMVDWSSSDEAVATVDHEGHVTTTGEGTAIITASYGELSVSCEVVCVEISGNLYAYNFYSGTGYGDWLDIGLNDMEAESMFLSPVDFIAADFNGHNGCIYGYDELGQGYRFDPATGECEMLGTPTNVQLLDMAYDYSSGTMYAVAYDASTSTSTIYYVNLYTGALVEAGKVYDAMVTLACDMEGNLYSISSSGILFSLKRVAGAGGGGGIAPLAQTYATAKVYHYEQKEIMQLPVSGLFYAQSMCYDHNNNVILWANPETGTIFWIKPGEYALGLGEPTGTGFIEYTGLFVVPETIPELAYTPVESISSQDMLVLTGNAKLPAVNCYPLNATNQADIVYTSADESIVKVENGLLVGVSVGNTTVTATLTDTAPDGSVTVHECTFQVSVKLDTDNIYGYLVQDVTYYNGYAWIGIDDSDPANYELKDYVYDSATGINYTLYCAEYVNGTIYAYGFNDQDWEANFQFMTINPATWSITSIRDMGDECPFVYDMAFDYTTGTLYAVAGSTTASSLYIVNMAGGSLIECMNFKPFIMSLAIDEHGTIYAMAASEEDYDPFTWVSTYLPAKMYTLNVEKGTCEFYMDTGVLCNQLASMAYDFDTGYIYWTGFYMGGTGYVSGLHLIDPAEKTCHNLGTIGGHSQVTGLMVIADSYPQTPTTLQNVAMITGTMETNVGDSVAAELFMAPGTAEADVVWTSMDPSVATVDENGVVTGVGAGITTVQAVVSNEGREFVVTATVYVYAPADDYFLVYNRDDNGFSAIDRTNPSTVTNLTEGEEAEKIFAMEMVNGVIYGYDDAGNFFTTSAEDGFQRNYLGGHGMEVQEPYDEIENFGSYVFYYTYTPKFTVRDVAWDASTGRLLALGCYSVIKEYYYVQTSTGAASVPYAEELEAVGGCAIYEVDLETGALTVITNIYTEGGDDYSGVYAMTVTDEGQVYVYSTYMDFIATINLDTGLTKNIATFQNLGYYGDSDCHSMAMTYDPVTKNIYVLFTQNGNAYFLFKYNVVTTMIRSMGAVGETYDDCAGLIINRHAHVHTKEVVAPTCTEDGYVTYTCECGHTYTEAGEKATGHYYVDGKCEGCGRVESTEVGDINGDGRINARDARELLRWIAGLVDTEIDEAIADYNNDGKVNARDARALLRKIAGLD